MSVNFEKDFSLLNMQNSLSIETLNVNNVDSAGNVVLNDEKLLDLIQLYPFLYNPRVRPFQDIDYTEWAWERITAAFNRHYGDLASNVTFTTEQLQLRWQILQPIIKKISKMFDLTAIPEPLRQIIVKINVQLEDQTTDVRPNIYSAAQRVILENIPMVEKLPLDRRLQLEAEVMDLLLSAELEAKATIKLTAADHERIEKEYDEFLRALQLKELFVLKENVPEDKPTNSAPTPETNANYWSDTVSDGNVVGAVYLDANEENHSTSSIVHDGDLIGFESIADDVDKMKQDIFSKPTLADMLVKPCLVSLPRKILMASAQTPIQRWIPLTDAMKYVRPCTVRVKRYNMEDYAPLSSFKQSKFKT